MKKIRLTSGRFTVVDDDDYKELSKCNWYENPNGYVHTALSIGNQKTITCKTNQILELKTGECKESKAEFDFNEFFQTYGIAIGISAFLFVVAVIFIAVTIKGKK